MEDICPDSNLPNFPQAQHWLSQKPLANPVRQLKVLVEISDSKRIRTIPSCLLFRGLASGPGVGTETGTQRALV